MNKFIELVHWQCKGVDPEKQKKSRVLKPIVEYSHDGDQYKVQGSADGVTERTQLFLLDVEQEETTIDGRKVKVKYTHQSNESLSYQLSSFYLISEHLQAQR